MKTYILIFFLSIMCMITSCQSSPGSIRYPETARVDSLRHYFGEAIADPYAWLENDTAAATAAWVQSQNEVTFRYLAQIPFREGLRKRLTELMDYPKYSSPFKKHGVYYFFKNNGLQNQSVLYRQASLDAEAEVLLDPNKLSDDGTVALTGISFSNDGRYMAYSIARSGSDWNEIYVMELSTRRLLDDQLRWVKFSGMAWQGEGFYYSAYQAPEAGKEYSNKNEYHKIFFHRLGEEQSADRLVYENRQAPLRTCRASVTDDEKFLFIYETESTSGNSFFMQDLTKAQNPLLRLVEGFENDYSVVGHYQGKLYLLTNYKAPRQRLMEIDPARPQRENWKEVIPESKDVLESVTIVGGRLAALYMKDASHHAYIYDLAGKVEYEIKLPGLGSVATLSGEKDDNEAFYAFSSYTFPPGIYRFDVAQNRSEIFHKAEVSFEPEAYVSRQVFVTSKDGTRIPMSITYKKGLQQNAKNPAMLYGYGGFNISLTPAFRVSIIPFLESGGVYAVANLRGGGEYGEEWHRAGTKLQKQNVFDDFMAAAEYLINEGYTTSERLAINGGSNGGLLVGACMTQRPELFAVAVPEVGVLDMLRYHLFTIGWAWAADYGTSDESIEMYRYLKAYSPLHNVKEGVAYPATLVTTADHDDRVVPAHSFKFTAALQAVNRGGKPSLIRIDSKAGHGAGRPIGKIIDAQTDVWSFVMYNLGMKPKY